MNPNHNTPRTRPTKSWMLAYLEALIAGRDGYLILGGSYIPFSKISESQVPSTPKDKPQMELW